MPVRKFALLQHVGYTHLGTTGGEIYSSVLFSLFFPGPAPWFHQGPLAPRCLISPICDFVQQFWRHGGYLKVICGCRLFDDFSSFIVLLEEGGLSEGWVICSVWSTPWWSQGALFSYLMAPALQNTFGCLPISSNVSSRLSCIFAGDYLQVRKQEREDEWKKKIVSAPPVSSLPFWS